MNVMVLSGNRNKRWKRHSIAVFNNNNNNDNPFTDLKPLREIGAQQSLDEECAARRSSELNKYLCILKELVNSGDGLTTSDMELLRKACMERVIACRSNSEKLFELKSTIHAINDIPISSSDALWLAQYQYILNWCYSQLRFICDPRERPRLFQNIKEKYRQMFKQLINVPDEEKLPTYLHWSQICYQYAEFVDDESLAWCAYKISNTKSVLLARSSDLSTFSRRKENATENGNRNNALETDTRKAVSRRKRYVESVDLIRENLEKTLNIRSSLYNDGFCEKIVM
uniref:Uncharacterized protein n=2 Tax=Parascaris univalens TaxID=6257 RepID=A0A915BJK3_PARUN